jgi:hypothetical protein
MSETLASGRPVKVPRGDLIILPLISVATLVVLLVAGEVIAREIFPQDAAGEPCEYRTADGFRYRPFCTSQTKVWEGPWITQQFNECGYRTAEPCEPRPPDALRMVVAGSSTARGALVNYADSFAARASDALSRDCGEMVDVQNLGTEPSDVDRIDRRLPEALALHPSAIVMTIGPYDLVHLKDPPLPPADTPAKPFRPTPQNFLGLLRESRLFELMQYELYRDPAFQIRTFLLNGDPADYVRTPLSAAWRQRVADLGELLGRITAQTAPAHVPVLLLYIPERAQAAMAKEKDPSAGIDPLVLGRALGLAATEHGVSFHDATPAFAAALDFQSLFYLTDGHPQAGGHAALAGVVTRALLLEPTLSRCTRGSRAG